MIVCLTIILTKNEVIFLDIFDNVKHNWKLKELKNLKEKGHIRNDISVVYIYVPKGMGQRQGRFFS